MLTEKKFLSYLVNKLVNIFVFVNNFMKNQLKLTFQKNFGLGQLVTQELRLCFILYIYCMTSWSKKAPKEQSYIHDCELQIMC